MSYGGAMRLLATSKRFKSSADLYFCKLDFYPFII